MENLNYLQIVLEGYGDINTRNFLKNYFIRKWKKAEENHYSLNEFFLGLRNVITIFEEDIKTRKAKRANELYTLITMNEGDEVKVKEFKDEIQWMRENDSFYAYINGYGNLSGVQVLFIKNAILLAYGESLPKEKPTNEKTLPKFEDYFQTDIKDIEGLKKYLSNLKGKKLACAMHILIDRYKVKIPDHKIEFVKSFKDVKEISAENTAFNKITTTTKLNDRDYQIIEDETVSYF